jgi:2-methylisocitrate lyase-like PEP mutase family enzyme
MSRFRELVASERPLVLPGAHDALSALLVKRAGFKGYFVGGFTVAGVRYGVPDIGLLGMRDFAEAYRDILAVSDLPVLVDADNGYGDMKNIVYLLHTYERLGAHALFFEDQVSPKRCGHMVGKQLIATEEMEGRIRAAAQNRLNPDTFLIARTDAREVHGLDEALRRGERYIRAGADGLFIEAPVSVEEMERIGRAFDVPQLANMLEGGRTPILPPAELERLGFRIVIYGISLLLRIAATMERALEDLKVGRIPPRDTPMPFDHYKDIVEFGKWAEIERRYGR